MEQQTNNKKHMDFEGVPHFSIIIPFRQEMNDTDKLSNLLQTAANKAEIDIHVKYSPEQALPLIKNLREAIKEIRGIPDEKTLAIFVSGDSKKVYYFTTTNPQRWPSFGMRTCK